MAKSESEKDMRQKNENLNKTVQEQDVAERNQAYNEYVKQVTPTHNLALKMLKAFVTGGIICCIGQVILNIAQNAGLDKDTSGGWCSMILVLMSVILTGLNIYPSIAKFGGGGGPPPRGGGGGGGGGPPPPPPQAPAFHAFQNGAEGLLFTLIRTTFETALLW